MPSPSRHVSQGYNMWWGFLVTKLSLIHSVCAKQLKFEISYSCWSRSPHQQLTPPSPDHQAPLLCKRTMADGDILEKVNVGEVGEGNEGTKGVFHGNACWKYHSFRWYRRVSSDSYSRSEYHGNCSATSPVSCTLHNPWWTGKECLTFLKETLCVKLALHC